MRLYGSIHSKFWTNADIQRLSDQAKLLTTYLLSSSHTNMLGCFRIPMGYVAEDLKWGLDIVKKAFDELSQIDFLTYDPLSGWVMIHHFLKYNPIENPNQGRSIAKLFDKVPKNLIFIHRLINAILEYAEFIQEEFLNSLETLSKQFRNQDQNQNQDKNQYQDQNQEFMSGKPDVVSFDKQNKQKTLEEKIISVKNSAALYKSQAKEILEFLNEKTGRGYRINDTNLKFVIGRLKSGITVGQCFQIIAKKTREWLGNPKTDTWLRPATLFKADNCEQYLGELLKQKPEEKLP